VATYSMLVTESELVELRDALAVYMPLLTMQASRPDSSYLQENLAAAKRIQKKIQRMRIDT